MLRLVLDTNILVSATIERAGASSKILQAWQQDKIELITSPVLLVELQGVLKRPRIQKYQWMEKEELAGFVAELYRAAIQTSGQRLIKAVVVDPSDDYVISAAIEGSADYIVTGNIHLLDLNPYQGIEILRPAEMLKVLLKKS